MIHLLRIGVIGLGRRWQKRYRPALLALQDRFELRLLCDEVHQHALNEAYRLGCEAVAGPTQLLERDDLDAVLLLDPGWYRLWPVEAACRAGTAVFCCPLPGLDEAHAADLCRRVREHRLPVMMELPLRLAPATLRLRELLETRLGSVRTIVGEVVSPSPAAPCGLLDWCAHLLGAEPERVRAVQAEGSELRTLFLEFGAGRAVQLTFWHAPFARRALRLHIVAERGTARVELPNRLHWSDADGRHACVLRRQRPLGLLLLERFHEALSTGQPPRPDFADACRVLDWVRSAAPVSSVQQETPDDLRGRLGY